MLFFVSCVSSTTVSTTPSPQQKKTQQKQALKDRIQTIRTEQNHRIDSLIAAEDTRLQKDKNGNIIRPNWVSNSGTPLYYSTNKRSARKAIKANALSNSGALGLNLNGEGIHMGIWDAGHIFAAHDEFTGESAFFEQQLTIEVGDAEAADVRDSHPTAVASIVIAKGLLDNENYDVTGISPQLEKVYSYDWYDDYIEIIEQLLINNNTDFILSNHSYGVPLYNNNQLILTEDKIGGYIDISSILDQITYVFQDYLFVVAAGNDGKKTYPGQSVEGLDQLTAYTTAKNVLTVGSFSMDDNNENFTPSDFSSAGPTNDFRIKPEICAVGQNLRVAYWDENNPETTDKYIIRNGTSFAAPGAAAAVALLQQLHKQTHTVFMRGATAKALLCHTADDISQWGEIDITGPDVKTGYGAINLEKAAAIIQKDVTETNTIVTFNLNENETETLYFQVLEQGTITATLSWYDPHAEENVTNTLINDLDLRIIQDNTTYFPWKLPTNAQQAVAVLGDNSADNLEQIKISENLGGAYTIQVSHKGTLRNRSQEASLIISGPGIIIETAKELENIQKDGFLVSPVPARETLTITALKNDIAFQTVRLFNLNGSEVAQKGKASFSRTPMQLDINNLTTGSYILVIETPNGKISKNIIIR